MKLFYMELWRQIYSFTLLLKSKELYTTKSRYCSVIKKEKGDAGKIECRQMSLPVLHVNHIPTRRRMGKKGPDLRDFGKQCFDWDAVCKQQPNCIQALSSHKFVSHRHISKEFCILELNTDDEGQVSPYQNKELEKEKGKMNPVVQGQRQYGCIKYIYTSCVHVFSCPVTFDSLRPHGLQHARPPCPSPSLEVCPSSCPLHW